MKIKTLLAVACIVALASCSKEYTCECIMTDSAGVMASTTVSSTATYSSSSDAEDACNSTVTSGTMTTECKIK